ncbi:MAG: hypothetical protein WC374_06820 [Phycisphaerae bacterium]
MIDYIRIDRPILKLEVSDKAKMLLGLIKSFNCNGLGMSNVDLADLLCCSADYIGKLLREISGYVRIQHPRSRYRKIFYSGENNGVGEGLLSKNGRSNHNSTPSFCPTTQSISPSTPSFCPTTQSKSTDITEVTEETEITKSNMLNVAQHNETQLREKSEEIIEEEIFNLFRLKYPGTKRGNKVEFGYFCAKIKNWREVLPLLLPALEKQIRHREFLKSQNAFIPQWKNLKTWIYNQCWTEEPGEVQNGQRNAGQNNRGKTGPSNGGDKSARITEPFIR